MLFTQRNCKKEEIVELDACKLNAVIKSQHTSLKKKRPAHYSPCAIKSPIMFHCPNFSSRNEKMQQSCNSFYKAYKTLHTEVRTSTQPSERNSPIIHNNTSYFTSFHVVRSKVMKPIRCIGDIDTPLEKENKCA